MASRAASVESQRSHLELAFRFEKLASDLLLTGDNCADERTQRGSDQRGAVGQALRCAFPLPPVGTFLDLPSAING